MSDTPRSIIMPNDPEREFTLPDKAIISPEEAAHRVRTKGVPDGGKGGKHAISRAEAVSIAVQIGQEVYDQLRKEHAESMGQLQQDLSAHLGSIRNITATNILDIQRRSFSYRLRRDFAVDRMIFGAWLREKWGIIQLACATDWEMALAWLELHGLKQPPKRTPVIPIKADPSVPPDELHVRDAQGNTTKIVNLKPESHDEPQHVGAPSELPEPPEIARTLVLSDGGDVTGG